MVTIDGTDISGATIDGTEVQEITIDGESVWTALLDDGLYLQDDWGDGKITDREDSTTTVQTLDGTEYETIYRPEWDENFGSSTVTSDDGGYVVVNPDDAIFTGSSFWEDDMAIEVDFELQSFTSSGGRTYAINLFTDNPIPNNPAGSDETDWAMWIHINQNDTSGESFDIRAIDNGASSTETIVSSSWTPDLSKNTVRVEKDGSNYELFLNDSSMGTGSYTFSSEPTITHTGFSASSGSEDVRTYNLRYGTVDGVKQND